MYSLWLPLRPENLIKRFERSKVCLWLKLPVDVHFSFYLLIAFSVAMIAAAPLQAFPDVIPLPNGFQPEGIAVGKGHTFYVGSIPTGAVYRGDLRTGEGAVLVPATDRDAQRSDLSMMNARACSLWQAVPLVLLISTMVKLERILARFQLTTDMPSFINDVVITKDAAYFTNSPGRLFYTACRWKTTVNCLSP